MYKETPPWKRIPDSCSELHCSVTHLDKTSHDEKVVTVDTSVFTQRKSQHHDPIFTKAWIFWPHQSLQQKLTSNRFECTGVPGGEDVASHSTFRNEPNHKQKQRCWRVTDDGSINVLSISRSECWMLANRTKQLVTQKAGTLLTAGDRHEYARETRRATVVKTGTARFKIWCYKCKGKHWRALSIIPRDHHRLQNDKVLSNSSLLIAYPDLGATTADEELCRN